MPDRPGEGATSEDVDIVSYDWSHYGQRVGCGNPWRASCSAVQHLSTQESQTENFTLGGAHDFQLSFQELEAEYWLSVIHRQTADGSKPGHTARGQESSWPLRCR
jgi:hypothetical protein